MGRQAVVAGVMLACVVVAGATAVAFGYADEVAEETEARFGVELGALGKRMGERADKLEADKLGATGASAHDLSAGGTLWSHGRLLVTKGSEGSQLFAVDPDLGPEGTVLVDAPLKVSAGSELGDVEAGAVSATAVTASGFATGSGAWKIDSGGTMNASGDLIVGGNGSVAGNLAVGGGSFNIGEGVVYTRSFDARSLHGDLADLDGGAVFAVSGTVVASSFRSNAASGFEFSDNVVVDQSIRAAGGAWSIDQDGLVSAAAIDSDELRATLVEADSIVLDGVVLSNDQRGADAAKDVLGRDFRASGDVVAAGALDVSGPARFSGGFDVGGGRFTVDTGGDATLAGTLSVSGMRSSGDVTTSGLSADSIVLDGVVLSNDQRGADAAKDVLGRDFRASGDVVAAGALDVSGPARFSGGFDVGGGRFTVDTGGDATLAGTLSVSGMRSSGDVTVGGTLVVSGDVRIEGSLDAAGLDVPDIASGSCETGVSVSVPGLRTVVVCPSGGSTGAFWVTRGSDGFVVGSDEPGTFEWIATW